MAKYRDQMRASEIATTLVNGNITEARSGLVGRRSPQGNARLGVLVLETVEELVDSHDHTWPDAIERIARLIKGDADYIADANYENDTERDNEPRYV